MPFDFSSLAPRSESVRGPDGKQYLVRGASAAAAVAFREANIRAQRLEDGKLVGLSGLVESEPLLVSLCLFECDDGGRLVVDAAGNPARPVPVDRIKSWPVDVMKSLYEWVVDNSPGLMTRSRESMTAERDRLNRLLAEQEEASAAPKG